jgi:hypothetical protein
MEKKIKKVLFSTCLFYLAVMFSYGYTFAGEGKDMGGWGVNDAYNKFYDVAELDSFKANVVKIAEKAPMPGMSPGVILKVKESNVDNETTEIHVCPTWYRDAAGIGLRRGDRVKIRGVWAEIDGRDVFMASKIKKGDYFVLKVRLTKDGTPFWTMSDEQLAEEQQDKNDNQ